MKRLVRPVALLLALSASACVHTEEERQKRDFEKQADKRISHMEGNIKKLEARRDQLLGQPKLELTAAVDKLKQETASADAELKELKNREAAAWVQKKSSVDQDLYNMDEAYNDALRVFEAH